MKKLTLLFAIIVLMISSAAFAQKTWTGATSTAWNTAGNWSPSGVPTAAQNVTIPVTANQPLISGITTPVCNNLTVNSGATLTITGTSGSSATLTVAGTATFNGTLSIGGHWQGNLGKLVTSSVVWNSTSAINAYVNGRMEVSGNWTFASGSSVDMSWCWVTFTGTGNSTITNNSANSKFSSLTLGKTAAATTYIGVASSSTLTITGTLTINASNTLSGAANITTILQSNLVNNGKFEFDYGTVSLERASGTQEIQLATTGNYFNSLKINCGGTVTINNSLAIQGNLTIQSGTFNPQNNTLYVTGNWINTAGPAYFTEGTGKVVFNVIINKDGGRDYDNIIQNSENFNILELNNAYGDLIINSGLVVVTCNQYDWVAGGLNVSQGVFTALDLVDNGLFGRYYVSGTGTINVTNSDGYVDLCGNVNITGGTMNVYGGTTESYWPYTNNAWITISNGILNFADQGIRVSATTLTLTSNITGGTIKTAKNFSNYRSDFNPTGGTIELYGPTDASLYCVGTAALYGVKINKTASKDGGTFEITYPTFDRETGEVITDESRAQIVNLTSPVTFNGNFTLTSGTFNSNSYTIQAKRDWTNNVGPGSFNPGTGRVIFNGGNYHQICFNETFNILEVAKASGGSFRVTSGTVNCAQYDWTIGSIDVLGGTFTASDLYENGLYGGFYVNPGGTINLYQDIYQYIDLNGSLTFTNGGTINVYGGNGASQWASGANASVTMNAGTLDFKDQGITLTNLSPNTITENISGGTIRTTGGFFCNRADFTPVGGLLELYGSNNVYLEQSAGTLRDIKINKGPSAVVTVNTNITVVNIEVTSGTLSTVNKIINQDGHLYVENGGIFSLGQGAQLKLATDMSVNVNSGGIFKAIGTSANQATITRSGSFYYYFYVNNGGTISAKYAKFQYPANIILSPNAIIDPSFPFDYCTFSHGQSTYIFFNNSQELTIRGANFPTLPPTNTVAKTNNAGRITFRDATGAYSGPGYEYDPYNRIDWTVTQPGLWTGAVSTNWHTAGNWDDNAVPTTTTNVTIPASAPNMPLITNGVANCQNLLINGTLTIGAPDVSVSGNMTVNGTLAMNHDAGRLFVYGDVNWNSGSGAAFTANSQILAYGSWYFNAGANASLNNGTVKFYGETTNYIRNQSSTSAFYNLSSYKSAGAILGFTASSTSPLVINGTLTTTTGSRFVSYSGQDIVVKGNIVSYGTLQCTDGAVKLDGADQYLTPNVNDYFHRLIFSQTGNVMISTTNANTLHVLNNLTIQSGIFIPSTVDIYVGGDWNNSAGPDAFNETYSTVVFNGSGNVQRIQANENFMTLELNKPSGGLLEISNNAAVYAFMHHWTAGALSVVSGNYTALNLTNGVMGGDIAVNSGGTITMGKTTSNTNLIGRLFITGGTFNLVTNGQSQWPGNGNAQITMSGGELNVYPGGINIVNNPPYLFITDITGGTIRTEGSFVNNRNDFNPTAGTVELYGPENVILGYSTSTMYNLNTLIINKTSLKDNGGVVTLTGKILLRNLNIEKGTLNCTSGNVIVVVEDAEVNNEGKLSFEPNTAFGLYPSCQVNINEGGTFESLGTESQPIVVDLWGSTGFYDFGVGGTISSRFTTFNNCGNLIVAPSGFIDPDNAFYHCTFPYAVGALLVINNSQNVTLRGVQFPNVPISMNVKKTLDQGRVTMQDATGPGAGSTYEYDPYNRIDWRASQPGLWTGAISTDWHTAANWDDLIVPDSETTVTIPESTLTNNMPVVNSDAECNYLVVKGQLTVQSQTLTANLGMQIRGHLIIHTTVIVEGDISWSYTAKVTAAEQSTLYCKGNWHADSGTEVQFDGGTLVFNGGGNFYLHNYSYVSYFNNISIWGNTQMTVSDATHEFIINGNLNVESTSGFVYEGNQDILLKGHLLSGGTFSCNAGTVKLNGETYQNLSMSADNYFNNLEFNQSAIASVNTVFSNELNIKNDLIINSGIFYADAAIISIGRNWQNNAGPGAFVAEESEVIFDGNDPGENQFIYGGGSFNIIELRQHSDAKLTINDGAATICHKYDWTSGTLEVVNGVFNSYDLLDNRIAGNWILHNDGQIYLYDESTMGLGGNVTIYGGEFSVAGGQQYFSYWPSVTDASLVMSGGILEFNNQSIKIEENASCSFTSNITGGIIKTTGWFQAEHPGFDPSGGTVEIYGETDGYVGSGNGSEFYNLRINKSTISPAVGMENAVVKKALTVDGGRINIMDGYTLSCLESVNLNDGWLEIYYGGILNMGNFSALNVAEGAQLRTYGLNENRSLITGISPSSYYQITVADGGWISMRNTIIENLDETGLFIYNNAEVDVDNAFNGCIFRNGKSCNNALITINTNQDLVAENVEFDQVSKSRLYNVAKWVNSGSITFENYSGSFAGSAFEDDPYGRIHWDNPQPGFWTGAVSTDWFTAGNWDDGNVPDASTNVTIPAERMNMPVIATGTAYCNNITINGSINVDDAILDIAGNLEVNGNLTTTNSSGKITIHGDANWNSGATASMFMNSVIWIYGNWCFNEGSNVQLDNGTVFFMGNTTKTLSNYSPNSIFGGLFIYKTGGAYVELSGASNHPLTVNAALRIDNGSQLIINSDEHLSLRAHLYIDGNLQCNSGTIKFSGVNSSIKCSSDDYFNHVIFDQSGTASLYDSFSEFNIKGDLTINSGIFNPGDNMIKIQGSWYNNAGPDHFSEGNSRVIFNGSTPQFCSTEEFYILEIDKPLHYFYDKSESTIFCQIYDWTQGGMWIAGGSTFHAADLADDGIYGDFILWWNSIELHQDALQSIDLHGNISINGGEFRVYGGNDHSLWGTNANANLFMGSGVLDFVDKGIKIQDSAPYSFTSTISGGTIRTQNGFIVQSPGFDPMGGTVELYGAQNSAILSTEGGSFYNVTINKPTDFSTRATIWNSIVKNNFVVAEGLAEIGFGHELECWNNLAIEAGGWLATSSSTIGMKYLSSINVYADGRLSLFGYEGAMSHVKGMVSGEQYTLSILYGGYLEAMFTIFETLPEQGVYLAPGAIVNPNYSFTNCEFRNGMSGPTALLSVENDQDIIIENAVFPTNTWGGQYNVRKIFDSGSVTFINATGGFAGSSFENDPYNRIFWGDEFATHPISLPAGWSGISSYVIPGQPAMEDVFAPISDELIIAQTMTGMYYPGQNINTIGNWESHSAYKVKTLAGCTLTLTGDYETDLSVSLNDGWNLLPVVTPDGAPAADLLSPVNGFVIAKDVAGTGIYWPEYGINSLEYLLPGKAYFVLLTENGVVDYTGYKSDFTGSENLSMSLDLTAFNIQPTPSTHTIAILSSAIEAFEPGTLIGAYDQAGNCFGITKIDGENNSITIFGDDPTTVEKDGFVGGEIILFKNLSGFNNLTGLEPTFDQTLPHSDGFFSENGLSAITGFKASTGILGNNSLNSVKVFPNPSEGMVNISGIIPGTALTVTDLHGKVLIEKIADLENTEFDLTDNQPGVYFIKIEQNGTNIFRKIVLR